MSEKEKKREEKGKAEKAVEKTGEVVGKGVKKGFGIAKGIGKEIMKGVKGEEEKKRKKEIALAQQTSDLVSITRIRSLESASLHAAYQLKRLGIRRALETAATTVRANDKCTFGYKTPAWIEKRD